MPGSSSRIVEGEVTAKLEGLITGVNGVKGINSYSRNGGGEIMVSFDRHCDLEMARFEIVSIVRQAWDHLPQGVSYPNVSMHHPEADNSSRRLLTYTVNSYDSAIDIQKYCEKYLKPLLGAVKGVESVEIYGAQPLECHLTVDTEKTSGLGISMGEIRDVISLSYGSSIIGEVKENSSDSERISVLLETDAMADSMLMYLPIKYVGNKLIRLRDIAGIEHAERASDRYYRINGRNSIYVNIDADQTANQIKLAKKLRAMMDNAQVTMPDGYSISLLYDVSTSIEPELDKIYFRSFLTLLIILLLVAVTVRNWPYLLLITTGILLTLGISCLFYYFLGIEIQLYSLAGITISLNLIIDNLIVMADHLKRRSDLKAFTAILAASLTTIGALCAVFFLDETLLINLRDFVWVIVINLFVSLAAALLLVPALVDKLGLGASKRSLPSRRRVRVIKWLNKIYLKVITMISNHKKLSAVVVVFAFGFPVFLIPDSIKNPEKQWEKKYNEIASSEFVKDKLRPAIDVVFGGTMRLFAQRVPEGSYFSRGRADVRLQITASLPNGATIEQMNSLISQMERFLEGFDEIKRFETSVYNGQRASINVEFKPEFASSSFPYQLKSDVISKALTLGGGSWNVYGLEDVGFDNAFHERSGSSIIKITGYNYEDLSRYARQVADSLLQNRRIKVVDIRSEVSFWKDDYSEFYLEIDKRRLEEKHMDMHSLFNSLLPYFGQVMSAGRIRFGNDSENVILLSDQCNVNDVWAMLNIPVVVNKQTVKLSDFAELKNRQTPQTIAKENQQYVLYLQYEYIGSYKQDLRIQDKTIEQFNASLPIGYKLEKYKMMFRQGGENGGWNKYWLLLYVGVVIFFIASVLFNSLRQPMAIIAMIPPSFIGVFLAFYLFKVSFDQGGFASFILLSGITVNAAIYLISEYNDIRKERPHLPLPQVYLMAFNHKIGPILLTVISTVLGFVPFVIGSLRESFWYPMAVGTIGGLLMSVLILVLFLPVLIINKRSFNKQ